MLFNRNKPSYLEILVERIDNGDKTAEDELHRMFYNGLTSEKHNEARRKVYNRRLANNPNDSYALYMLALLEDNKTKSEQLYLKAAQLGNLDAMSALGLYYSEYSNDEYSNSGFGYDEKKSIYWYKQAADTGDPKAMVDYAV